MGVSTPLTREGRRLLWWRGARSLCLGTTTGGCGGLLEFGRVVGAEAAKHRVPRAVREPPSFTFALRLSPGAWSRAPHITRLACVLLLLCCCCRSKEGVVEVVMALGGEQMRVGARFWHTRELRTRKSLNVFYSENDLARFCRHPSLFLRVHDRRPKREFVQCVI